ncbi:MULTISPECIES: transposase [Micromonospora]|uniref:transposase n=1 Tax=Micromonospora TaxID=1873 RepID=UPI0027DE7075|nr:transposase [Micromonospora sp. M61]WTI24036.1 transposase [Micromonospora zamorensis]
MGYRQRSDERASSRNGYRRRERDARAATIDLRIPNCARAPTSRTELTHRRRAEQALVWW